jgi:hypothetical protein
MIGDSIEIILLFGAFGVFTNWFAWSRGFYNLRSAPPINIRLKQVVGVFAIYLGMMLIVAPYVAHFLIFLASPSTPPVGMINSVQVLILAAVVVSLILFCRSQGKEEMKKIWKNTNVPQAQPIYVDIGLGILAWFVSFPAVAVIGQFFDLIIFWAAGVETYEQVAVRYLKNTLVSPSQLTIALLTILVIAPSIEEFLFRGCLQTYFKRHLGTKAAIMMASFCFALFHFSSSQGVGNISLIASLFVFALFLGFVYERQSSLFASIGLHMTFNFASALRIMFSEG